MEFEHPFGRARIPPNCGGRNGVRRPLPVHETQLGRDDVAVLPGGNNADKRLWSVHGANVPKPSAMISIIAIAADVARQTRRLLRQLASRRLPAGPERLSDHEGCAWLSRRQSLIS